MLVSAEFGTPIDQAALDTAITNFEVGWGERTDERPPAAASGASPVVLAQALLVKTSMRPTQRLFHSEAVIPRVLRFFPNGPARGHGLHARG